MNCNYPNLENIKHLIFLQDTISFERFSEINDNILNKPFLEFVGRKKTGGAGQRNIWGYRFKNKPFFIRFW